MSKRDELISLIRDADNRPRRAAEELADMWIAGTMIDESWFVMSERGYRIYRLVHELRAGG